MFQSRLDRYIAEQKNELYGISYFHDDKPLVATTLKYFVQDRLSALSDLVSNEIYFDLISNYKNKVLLQISCRKHDRFSV
jgi:hypothetical protein